MSSRDWSDGMDDRDWTGWTLYYRLCGDGTDDMDLPTGGVWDSGEARMLLDRPADWSTVMAPTMLSPPTVAGRYPLPPLLFPPPPPPLILPPMQSRWVAAALQLLGLFGIAGIGRMYLGDTGLGVAQLLVGLLTCGVGAMVWGPVDAALIVSER